MSGGSVDDTTVQGNFIGTDASGTLPLGNGTLGVGLGDDAVVEGNVIAFNVLDGVRVTGGTVNQISANSIFANVGLGINLADAGANSAQNFPVLDSVTGGSSTTIDGTLNSTPGNAFRVQFFASPSCDPSLNGEGQTFIGETSLSTDGNGDGTFNAVLGVNLAPGSVVTATAIDSCRAIMSGCWRNIFRQPFIRSGQPANGRSRALMKSSFLACSATFLTSFSPRPMFRSGDRSGHTRS